MARSIEAATEAIGTLCGPEANSPDTAVTGHAGGFGEGIGAVEGDLPRPAAAARGCVMIKSLPRRALVLWGLSLLPIEASTLGGRLGNWYCWAGFSPDTSGA